MKRFAHAMVTLSALGLMVSAATVTGAQGQTPTIKQVMALHKAPLNQLKTALAANPPQWATIQGITKQFAVGGAALAVGTPPKGDPASWKQLAGAYATNAKALNDAAQKMDLASANAAFMKISTSCKACHDAHR
jgi:hypothetical protein